MTYLNKLQLAKMARDNTLHGMLWFFPIIAIIWGFLLAMNLADSMVGSVVSAIWHSHNPDLPVPIHGGIFSLILLLVFCFLTGTLLRWKVSSKIISWFESYLSKLPVVGKIYTSLKKMANIMGNQDKLTKAFQKVVRVPYLNGQGTCVCFMTNSRTTADGHVLITVFIPTPPNPTGGLLAEYPAEVVEDTNWTLDQGLEYCFSFGIVSPDSPVCDMLFDNCKTNEKS